MSIEVRDLSGNAPYVAQLGAPGSPSGIELAGTLTANGDTASIRVSGKITIRAVGTFGSGTIAVQRRINNVWATTSRDSAGNPATYTSNFDFSIAEAKADAEYRLSLSGATSPNIQFFIGTAPRDNLGSA